VEAQTPSWITFLLVSYIVISSQLIQERSGLQRCGYMDSSTQLPPTEYIIQHKTFTDAFKLLQLKGYDIILGCDWIKKHSPIGLDLREKSRHLTIFKEGITKIVFHDFTTPTITSPISTIKLEKICRTEVLCYMIQVNLIQQQAEKSLEARVHHSIEAILEEFEDIFSTKNVLPPHKHCDHEIPLKENSKPPNLMPYRVPQKQKDEVKGLIKTMLQDAIIRPSTNPYSSPVILVRKKMDHGGFA
jgi:hypothetical protein